MLIIPAIDLKDGHCVRLRQGSMTDATVFSEDPGAMARHWISIGARRLHLVDLNGAFAGKPKNEEAVKAVVKAIGGDIPVQLGGGIRDLDTVERYLDDGIAYIILGTAAVKTPGFLHDACCAFPGHILVGLDAKDGKIAVDGWSKVTGHDVLDLAKKFQDLGVEAIIYTDITRDGMMSGVNIKATVDLARELSVPVIASGGITDLKDVKALCEAEAEGILGAITGRAIYEGTLDFAEAQKLADKMAGENAKIPQGKI
jgi:phosphoribosylformimino-5-aminoimidazole carboxamide ribotide isomerase